MLTSMVLGLALATAEPGAAQAPPAKTPAQLDNEKVCVTVVPTGSIIGQRVCKTRKAWRKLEETQRRKAQESMDAANQATRAKD